MTPDSRRLLGTYRTPRFRFRSWVQCRLRGEVQIVGISDGRIPWPVTEVANGNRVLILYKDLARAVQRETAEAIKHWWGATAHSVKLWRKVLRVESTEALKSFRVAFGKSPAMRKAVKAMAVTLHDPARAAKIAASKRGKRRHRLTIAKMRRAATGRRHTEETRAKMRSERKGNRPPWLNPGWSAAENELLRTLSAGEVAKRTGRTLTAVYTQRHKLGVNDGRTTRHRQ